MRVLWLSHMVPFPPVGGARQRSYNLIRGASRRCDMALAALAAAGEAGRDAELVAAREALEPLLEIVLLHRWTHGHSLAQRIGVVMKSLWSRRSYTELSYWDKGFGPAVADLALRIRPDVIHLDTISLLPYLGALEHRPAVVLTHHNVESQMLERRACLQSWMIPRWYFGLEARRVKALERRSIEEVDRHIVCSTLDAARLEDVLGAASIDVVPNSVDVSYFTPPKNENPTPNSLVFVGGLSWYPNASAMRYFFDDVWASLTSQRPDTTITICGRSPPDWLRRLAQSDSRIRVMGFVEDMRPHVWGASAYVCPIFDGGGTKVKMLDALALGSAIVAHPVACEGIEAKSEEHLLLASEPQEFVRQILRVFDSPLLRARLGNAARTLVEEKYASDAAAQALVKCYERSLKERTRRGLDIEVAHAGQGA